MRDPNAIVSTQALAAMLAEPQCSAPQCCPTTQYQELELSIWRVSGH